MDLGYPIVKQTQIYPNVKLTSSAAELWQHPETDSRPGGLQS